MPGIHHLRGWFIVMLACSCGACVGTRSENVTLRRAAQPANQHADANDVVFRAIGLVGTPYRYGGNTPQSGFDCSGLVDYVFRTEVGIALPRTAEHISRIDAPEIPRDRLESGDLVFFHGHGRRVTHVGIYVGKGRFVHAPNRGGTVRLDRLDAPYWRTHFSGARRALAASD